MYLHDYIVIGMLLKEVTWKSQFYYSVRMIRNDFVFEIKWSYIYFVGANIYSVSLPEWYFESYRISQYQNKLGRVYGYGNLHLRMDNM